MRRTSKTLIGFAVSQAISSIFSSSLVFAGAADQAVPNIPRPQLPPLEVTPAIPQELIKDSSDAVDSQVRVVVKELVFTGNEQFSNETLSELVKGYVGKEVGLNELNEAVRKVKAYYRNNGYFLAQVVLPAQDLVKQSDQTTTVNIQVIEGKLNELKVETGEGINQTFMSDLSNNGISTGDSITEKSLVRNVILINALPGVRATSVLSPGKDAGTSDVAISVEPENKLIGYVAANTYGNRFTGRETVMFGLGVNNLAGRGDQLSVGGRVSNNEDLRAFNLGYVTPVSSSANLLSVGYSLVEYSLNGIFQPLNARGNSQYYTAFLDRSLYRDSRKGLNFRLGGIYKELQDKILSDNNRRDITNLEAGVSGEWVNSTGDVIYQAGLSVTGGNVSFKNAAAEQNDKATLKTEGHFLRYNLTSSRTQIFENGVNWVIRADYQGANKNLDIAEKMGIGAVNRWRQYAYLPSLANEGWMTGTDIKRDFGVNNVIIKTVSPYAFYDFGRGKVNHDPLTSNNRVLSRHYGAGVALGIAKQVNFDLSYSIQDQALEGNSTETSHTLWGQLRKDF